MKIKSYLIDILSQCNNFLKNFQQKGTDSEKLSTKLAFVGIDIIIINSKPTKSTGFSVTHFHSVVNRL
jgi:hypothetical protein